MLAVLITPTQIEHPCIPKGKLIETPTIGAPTFSLVSELAVSPLTYTSQVLNSNDGIASFGILNNDFTDVVVQPSLVSSLASRQPFQRSSTSLASRFCAFADTSLREALTRANLSVASFYLPSIPSVSCRSYCNISSAKVNPITFSDLIGSGASQLNVQ